MKALTLAQVVNDAGISSESYETLRARALALLEAYKVGREVQWRVDNARMAADRQFYFEWAFLHQNELAIYDDKFRDYENAACTRRDDDNKIIYDAEFFADAPDAPVQAPDWPDYA